MEISLMHSQVRSYFSSQEPKQLLEQCFMYTLIQISLMVLYTALIKRPKKISFYVQQSCKFKWAEYATAMMSVMKFVNGAMCFPGQRWWNHLQTQNVFHISLIKLSGLTWEFKYLGCSNFNFKKENNRCVKCAFSLLVRWLNISKHSILWILSLFKKEKIVHVDVSLDTSSKCFWTWHTILNSVLSSPEYAELEKWNCYDWASWSNQDFFFPITLL